MNNQEKGLLYEKYVKNFIIQQLGKNAYLWNECPENILIANNLIHSHNDMRLLRKDMKEGYLHNHKDIGIDIIQIENDKCSIVQCKNGYNNGLCVDDISGIMMRCAFIRDVNTFIYYTNCLSRNIRYTAKISPYVVNIDCSTKKDKLLEVSGDNKIYFVKLPYENNSIIEDIKTDIVPYSYQTEAVNKFKEYYQTKNRGILSLPCGCGKTYTSYLISNNYKHVVILSPLREFASQNLNRFIEYGYDKKNTLLVDTDGNRDIDSIKEFIGNHDNILISCTYNSMDLISECLELFKDTLFIIDEFHNLSKANISDDENNIFKLLTSDHKILFMSATPRIYDIEYDENESYDTENLFGDVVYQMTFTDAISNKYITDYKIWLPSIHENNEALDKELSIYDIDNQMKNRCKFLYSCIANNGSRKCIVYCKDTEDMKAMMKCMKALNDFYIMDTDMYSICCEDSEKERKCVLESFANNNDKIQLLFNIRILNECIDIPACDSIYISYAPKNKITTIQRISRATRTDKNNPYKIANVYIWCEAYEEILETLSSIKEYDIMFKDKIKVNAVDFYHNKEDKEIELVENDKVLLSNCIVGVKEFKMYSWEEKLEMVEDYIKENGRLPSDKSKNKKDKQFAQWISNQKKNYKENKYNMKDENIKNIWELFVKKHIKLFRRNDEKWLDNLQKLEKYIQEEKMLPSTHSKKECIKQLAAWVRFQIYNYEKKEQIMKDDKIRNLWEKLVDEYQEVFNKKSNEEKWLDKLNTVNEYIKYNKKLPSSTDINKEIQELGIWIIGQKQNYKNKKYIMKENNIRVLWEDFIEKNKILFMTNEEYWIDILEEVKSYITKYNYLPSPSSKETKIKLLARWIYTQRKNYKNQNDIMKNNDIKKIWEEFVKNNGHLFSSKEDIWIETLNRVKEYISIYNKLPPFTDIETDSLAQWINHQKRNYINSHQIMKQDNIRQYWKEFVDTYPTLFITNDEIWYDNKDKVEKYIEQYKKLPSQANKNKITSSLASWISSQKQNYKNKEGPMKNENILKEWEYFTKKHCVLFRTNEEIWMDTFQKVNRYIEQYQSLPSSQSKTTAQEIKTLGNWISSQRQNYKENKQIMKNEVIRNIWKDFTEKYSLMFMSNEEVWKSNLLSLENYIIENNILPSVNMSDDYSKKLGSYVHHQKHNYKNNKGIMKDPLIRQQWEEFTSKYPHLF